MITAVFQISDTGPGIAEEEQNKIFHEFHRINHKGKTDDLSYGLGLPIVKTLTEVMQGTISVESMVGKGSKFIVQIPLEIIQKKIKKEADQTYPVLFHDLPKKKAEILREYLEYQNCYQTFYSDQQNIEEILKKQTFNTAVIYHRNKSEDDRLRNLFIKYGIKHFYLIIKPANPENSFSSGFSSHVIYEPVLLSVIENLFCHSQQFIENNFHQKLTCSQLKDKKILIVEDDALNALLMKKILTPYQCEPVIAEYGKEALQLFREKTFDAVLLDINLPDINGIEVLRQFRKIPKKENIPVFALTGTDSFTEEDSKLFSGLLSKPYQSYEILSALKQVFS